MQAVVLKGENKPFGLTCEYSSAGCQIENRLGLQDFVRSGGVVVHPRHYLLFLLQDKFLFISCIHVFITLLFS